MPYITLRDQGIDANPADQIQRAAQAQMQENLLRQQMQQSAQSFPIKQQLAGAQASEATQHAAALQKSIELQQQAQDLQNQMTQTQLQFQKETDPIRKQMLGGQLNQLNQQIGNLKLQGQFIQAQTGEAQERGQYFGAEAQARDPALANYDVKETPGKLDAYGNQMVHTDYVDHDSGETVHSTDTFERGRGLPRVAYKSVWDPASGQMKRVPGVMETDPVTGEMNIKFPDDQAAPGAAQNGPATADPTLAPIVDKYFDPSTGKPTGDMPKTARDRAGLNALLSDPGQVKAYGLNAYSNLSAVLGNPTPAAVGDLIDRSGAAAPQQGDLIDRPGASSAAPAPLSATSPETNPAVAAPAPRRARPSTVTSSTDSGPGASPTSGASSSAPSGTTSAAGAVSMTTNPADGPQAGISPGGGAVKAGPDANVQLPASGAATPIMSGRKGSKFTDLPVNSFFMQNNVRYKKTGPTSAIPAEAAEPDNTPAPPVPGSQSQTLPGAMGT